MGYDVSYFAAKTEPAKLAEALGLKITGSREDHPIEDWWVARLKDSGQTILYAQDSVFGLDSAKKLAAFSNTNDILHCYVYEGGLTSMTELWSGGDAVWQVSHVAEEGLDNLTVHGNMPEPFKAIREKQFALQKDDEDTDHIFEIPVELFRQLTGFSYDSILDAEDAETYFVIQAPG